MGRPRLPRKSRRAESQAQEHAVRRLPRPRLDFPGGVQEGPPRQPARPRRPASIAPDDPHKWQKAVHLNDIHLQNGMQCVDCHFLRDVHGDGTLYNEPRAATSIECIDCHGTVDKRPTLDRPAATAARSTSRTAARPSGRASCGRTDGARHAHGQRPARGHLRHAQRALPVFQRWTRTSVGKSRRRSIRSTPPRRATTPRARTRRRFTRDGTTLGRRARRHAGAPLSKLAHNNEADHLPGVPFVAGRRVASAATCR